MEKSKNKLVYEKESYEVIGIVYEVFNKLGYGHKEKFYQKAIAEEFRSKNIPFRQELRVKIKYKEKELGVYILDFLVFDKIVIELKQGNNFSRQNIKQLYSYLKATNLKLGLLINFASQGIRVKRIANLR